MNSILEKAGRFWLEFSGRLTARRDTAPIDSVAGLEEFVATRSAYVAQKTLYNYVKARMGTRYPRMFEDDVLMTSLNIAKRHVFAGCLSDLTVFAVGTALSGAAVDDEARQALARQIYETGLRDGADDAPEQFSPQDAIDAFNQRLAFTDWSDMALRPENFTQSPRTLYRWAPIADKLKKFDTEIVENSVKFAWRDIREQFGKRLDAAAIVADWSARTAS